jgi:uncharacterized membrane protein YbhN (UPF0104 family)
MVLMVAGLAYYLWHNGARTLSTLRAMSAIHLFAALLCILPGKMAALYLMRASLRLVGSRLSAWHENIWVYASSDIAKYVPGGVWAIVGRVVRYRSYGMSAGEISKALLLEHLGLSMTALLVSLPSGLIILGGQGAAGFAAVAVFVFVAVLLGLVGTWRTAGRRLALSTSHAGVPGTLLVSFAVMIAGWVSMGTSFSLLLPDIGTFAQWFWSVGVYAAALIAGMAAVFAPAGAGVREGVLVLAGQLSGIPATTMLDVAILNRALWLVADLLFFIGAVLVRMFTR